MAFVGKWQLVAALPFANYQEIVDIVGEMQK